MPAARTIIMGAAGRDFHNFNVFFRDNPAYEVVAFTATQIPEIAGRRYPPSLAGARYPAGIAIYPESDLEDLIRRESVAEVVFAYGDADVVIVGTPINLARFVRVNKPLHRARYDLQVVGTPTLDEILRRRFAGQVAHDSHP